MVVKQAEFLRLKRVAPCSCSSPRKGDFRLDYINPDGERDFHLYADALLLCIIFVGYLITCLPISQYQMKIVKISIYHYMHKAVAICDEMKQLLRLQWNVEDLKLVMRFRVLLSTLDVSSRNLSSTLIRG